MNEKEMPEVLDKITDVVLKYRPKDKKKKPRKRKKREKKFGKLQRLKEYKCSVCLTKIPYKTIKCIYGCQGKMEKL